MKNILKSSFIFKWIATICCWFSQKWNDSEFCWLISRDLNDVKTKNSSVYHILTAPFNLLFDFFAESKFIEILRQSVILKSFSQYRYGVYVVVLLAPFIPTMLCVALAILTFVSFVLNQLFIKEKALKFDSFTLLVVGVLATFAFFSITSLTPVSSLKISLVYLPFVAFLFPVCAAINSKKELYKIVTMFVTSGIFVSLYGIYQQFFGNNEGHAWLDNEMFTDIGVRVYSTFGNPNVLGEYLLFLIPLSVAMFWTSEKVFAKVYFVGAAAVSALCMIFTQSRGCWLGLILAAAIYIILVDKRFIILGIIALMAMPFVLPQSIIDRFTSIGNLGDSSTSYRVFIWYGTFNMLKAFGLHGLGLGTDAFNMVYPLYSYESIIAPHAHNIYLVLLCESGWLGLGIFIITMIVALKKMYVGFNRDRKGFIGIVSAACIAGLLGILLQGAFDYIWYNYRVFLIFWMFIAIGLSAGRLSCDKTFSCDK